MSQLQNPYFEANELLDKFEARFEERAYDGYIIWSIRELFLTYKEGVALITEYAREHFTLDHPELYSKDVVQFLQDDGSKNSYIKNIVKKMKKKIDFVERFNRERSDVAETGVHDSQAQQIIKTEKKLWETKYPKEMRKNRDFKAELQRWLKKIRENLIKEDVKVVCDRRQESLGLPKLQEMSLEAYIAERIRVIKCETNFNEGSNELVNRGMTFLKPGEEALRKYTFVLSRQLRDMLMVFNNTVLKAFVQRLEDISMEKPKAKLHRALTVKPLKLGSFDVHQINSSIYSNFTLSDDQSELLIHPPEGSDVDIIRVSLSVLATMSINDVNTRKDLMQGQGAYFYFFAYPLTPEELEKVKPSINDLIDNDTGLFLLLSTGGYVYLDKEGRIVSVTGLKSGASQISFVGPFNWDEAESRAKDIRFHDITINELIANDALQFAFLPPGTLGLGDHGGFIYKCRSLVKGKDFEYQCFLLEINDNGGEFDNEGTVASDELFRKRVEDFQDTLEQN